jgi:hypothetical protein
MRKIFLILFIAGSLSAMGQTQMSVSVTTTNSCFRDGTATAIVSGGTAPYTYEWYYNYSTQVGTASLVSGLINGPYSVVVTDANGEMGFGYGTVSPNFDITLSGTPITCNNDGTATVTPTGGTAPYIYNWNSGQTTPSISNLSLGTYYVIVTDANGCENHPDSSKYVHIYSNSPVTLSISNVPGACNVPPSSTVTPSGGTAPYTYYWNTSPVQTSATASGLKPGNLYEVTVTDANGCIQNGYSYPYNNTNTFGLTLTHTNEVCGNNTGTASATPNAGTAPFSYLWSNGMTTQSISGLAKGNYSITVTDAQGCSATGSTYVDNESLVMANVNYGATCVDGNGTAAVTAWGGTPPYSYLWSNGQTSATFSNLNYGTYNVVISDAGGCTRTKSAYIYKPWNCSYSLVTGKVFNDINGNCIQDGGENGIANTMVYLAPGYGYSTNWDGTYYVWVLPGTYTVSHTPLTNWTQICPGTPGTITVNVTSAGITYSNNNFGDQVTPGVQDLEVKLYCGGGRPGGLSWSPLIYKNNGGSAISGTVSYTHSNQVTYYYSYPVASNYNSGTLTAKWNFTNLMPGEARIIYPYTMIPIGTPLGTHLDGSASIGPISGDMVLPNNIDSCYGVVIGSYDPNDLRVSPQGATDYGYITSSDSILSYMINFQNTGTDTAFIVVVRDTLDMHLDPASIHDLFSSHNVELSVVGNLLKFTFNDIDLLDSTHNEPASHGFVSFKIKIKDATPIGTEIRNQVDIYFDYNDPVATNEVLNTLSQRISGITNSAKASNGLIQVYPNPAHADFTVSYDLPNESSASLKLFSVLGQEMTVLPPTQQSKGLNYVRLSSKDLHLNPGVYVLKLYFDENIMTTKIIVTE